MLKSFLALFIAGFAIGQVYSNPILSEKNRKIENGHKSMKLISKATFEMGTGAEKIEKLIEKYKINHPEIFEGETPRHQVTIDSFYMDKYEVTNKDFNRFLKNNTNWQANKIPAKFDNGKYLSYWKDNKYPKGEDQYPVTNVNWFAAMAYCNWLGKRLPTEAEWEYAARGGLTDAEFPWGNEIDASKANYQKSGFGKPVKVGSYQPNGFGLFDMAGNVWEFTLDEWNKYSSTPQINPISGGNNFSNNTFYNVSTRRAIRGGSWGGSPINLRITYRDSHPPTGSERFVGFRCAVSALKN